MNTIELEELAEDLGIPFALIVESLEESSNIDPDERVKLVAKTSAQYSVSLRGLARAIRLSNLNEEWADLADLIGQEMLGMAVAHDTKVALLTIRDFFAEVEE